MSKRRVSRAPSLVQAARQNVTRTIAFIFNAHAGGGACRDWLEANRQTVETLAAGGPVVVVENNAELQSAVDRALAQKCDAIVAGGGDGTVNAIASNLAGLPTALGVVPLGTLNHFARDSGVPIDPAEALNAIAGGYTAQLDVGEVNGHIFLNNSSIGMYVDMVLDRERQQTRLGRGKWPAFAWAMIGTLKRYPFLTVNLTIDGKAVLHRTPFVFVGNNAYLTEGLHIGQRTGLRGGELSAYVADHAGRWRLLTLGLRALLGRLREARDFRVFSSTALRVDARQRHLRVALDGELRRLNTPLLYRSQAGALRVILPLPIAKDEM